MERYQDLKEMQRGWKAPAELFSSTPRDVELTAGGKAVFAMAILLFLGAVAAAVGLSTEVTRQSGERQAIDNGVETQAVVTRHWRSGGKDAPRRIAYEFVHGGRTYSTAVKTPRRIWEGLSAGSAIRVRYSPERPELSHPVEWEGGGMPYWLPGVAGAATLAVGALLLWLIRREKALLSDGRLAPAVIVAHQRTQHGKYAKYEFAAPGAVGKGHTSPSRKPPEIGATITVIYDPERPGRNALYPMCMVRVVR